MFFGACGCTPPRVLSSLHLLLPPELWNPTALILFLSSDLAVSHISFLDQNRSLMGARLKMREKTASCFSATNVMLFCCCAIAYLCK